MGAKSRFSQGIANFICDKISEGYTITRLVREYQPTGQVVSDVTIYRWKDKYPDFRDQLALAYQTHLYRQMDELRDLSEELLQTDKILEGIMDDDSVPEKDKKLRATLHLVLMRDRRDNIRVRIDAIKFSLAHIAPKLVPELKDQVKTQVAIQLPQIQIVNYRTDDTKLIQGN